jgi:hypothetical protein
MLTLNATLLHFRRYGRRLWSLVLIGAAALASCDYDQPIGPRLDAVSDEAAAPEMTKPGTVVAPTPGRVTWRVLDWDTTLVAGAVFTWDDGTGPISIADNSALDLDGRPGSFEIAAVKRGDLCPTTPPSAWINGAVCRPVQPVPPEAGELVDFNVYPEYSLYWSANNYSGLAGPSTYTVRSVDGGFSAVITDNGAGDRFKTKGMIWLLVPSTGAYELCQTQPPPRTLLPSSPCQTITVQYGLPAYGGMFMNWGQSRISSFHRVFPETS